MAILSCHLQATLPCKVEVFNTFLTRLFLGFIERYIRKYTNLDKGYVKGLAHVRNPDVTF